MIAHRLIMIQLFCRFWVERYWINSPCCSVRCLAKTNSLRSQTAAKRRKTRTLKWKQVNQLSFLKRYTVSVFQCYNSISEKPLPPEIISLVESELNDIISNTFEKININQQLDWTEQIMKQKIAYNTSKYLTSLV